MQKPGFYHTEILRKKKRGNYQKTEAGKREYKKRKCVKQFPLKESSVSPLYSQYRSIISSCRGCLSNPKQEDQTKQTEQRKQRQIKGKRNGRKKRSCCHVVGVVCRLSSVRFLQSVIVHEMTTENNLNPLFKPLSRVQLSHHLREKTLYLRIYK